ncbi:MAG: 16S rRNA (cytidine(1402)-2'-O)-methyltransferase [Oscillospiraceae bacterium]|jgi:16S rRNA (cytidine1402-2'-O)-methyltransferase|nr:16S rRNA (cytidine(1402)-2'-O)-methyltransferase [Oscillospiraceae bacterium]
MSGTLYLIGTPVGNLGDLSPRAARILSEVDFIAAEDTRVTLKLLNHLNIKKPLVSYHEHNKKSRGEQIAARLFEGENGALCSDAGMPCVSDPGEDLVRLLGERGIPVTGVPGPTAAMTALSLSGLPAGRFCFEGFLSTGKSSREKHLASLAAEPRTMIFYEAPHKLAATLRDLLRVFGDRRAALCRELTKLHEEVWRATLSEAAARYSEEPPRGEFVIVIEGAKPIENPPVTMEEAVLMAKELLAGGLSPSDAAKEAAARTGLRKGDIYRRLHAGKDAVFADD